MSGKLSLALTGTLGDPVIREDTNPVFTCSQCGVLVGRDGMSVHGSWHNADEVREPSPPWASSADLSELSEPIVFTRQGPVPFSQAPQLIKLALAEGRVAKLEELVHLLLDPYARTERITQLRKELGV